MVVIIIFAGCERSNINNAPNTLADKLYQYKDTYIGDNSKVVAIVDLLPHDGMDRDKVNLQTHNTPYGAGVYYKTDDRAGWRENAAKYEITLKRNAAIMFGLIINMDSLSIDIKDQYNYTDQPEDCFAGFYIILESLNDYFATDYFTQSALQAATVTKKDFYAFVDKVMSMESPYNVEMSGAQKAINDIIGKGWEVMANSGMGASFILEENIITEEFNLEQTAEENNIDITEYYGKKIDLHTVTAVNYAGQEPDTSYAFAFCDGELIAYKNIKTDENAIKLIKKIGI